GQRCAAQAGPLPSRSGPNGDPAQRSLLGDRPAVTPRKIAALAQGAGGAHATPVAPNLARSPLAFVAGVRVLQDDVDQRLAAQRLCQRPAPRRPAPVPATRSLPCRATSPPCAAPTPHPSPHSPPPPTP